MTSRTINRAIKHTGLIINKGSGYQYFTDAVTNELKKQSMQDKMIMVAHDFHQCSNPLLNNQQYTYEK
jgi:hypothetical protein